MTAKTNILLLTVLAFCCCTLAALPSGPLKVIYIDLDPNWNVPAEVVSQAVDAGAYPFFTTSLQKLLIRFWVLGYNVIILAFFLETGPTDVALAWESAGAAAQLSTMSYVHSKNAVVLVSAGLLPLLFLSLEPFPIFSALQKAVRPCRPPRCLPRPLAQLMAPWWPSGPRITCWMA